MAARSTFTRTSGSVITSAWANSLRDHVVPYTGAADGTTEGMLSVNTADDTLRVGVGASTEVLASYGPWTSFTPVITQGQTLSASFAYARFRRSDSRTITGAFRATISSGLGTPATPISISSLPATAFTNWIPIGTFLLFDLSALQGFAGAAFLESTTTIDGRTMTNPTPADDRLGVASFTGSLSVGDTIAVNFEYEAAFA